jgi:hypothetical protein
MDNQIHDIKRDTVLREGKTKNFEEISADCRLFLELGRPYRLCCGSASP